MKEAKSDFYAIFFTGLKGKTSSEFLEFEFTSQYHCAATTAMTL